MDMCCSVTLKKFLGLRTLTIIDWAVRSINRKRQQQDEPFLDISTLPLDDKLTFDLLKTCETTAVFQLESRGMKDLVRRLQPDFFEDITALVALFRPGPLKSGMVDDFIDRKHGRAKVIYPHPQLESILRSTYGVILYQEQVMQIAQVLAGYSLGGADILRKAMGKKTPEEMAKQRAVFTEGAIKRRIDAHLANQIFDLMEKFAGYGFNKSHSAAYALLSYQTAWLKAHYPAEFMAAVLSSDMDHTDKVVRFIRDCERLKTRILPPNINIGHYYFTVNERGEIEYGLGAIKGVGQAAIEIIIEERNKKGKFKSLFDLVSQLECQKVNRRALESLIMSGAMDCFGVSRATLMTSLDAALRYADQTQRNHSQGQSDLFGALLEDEETQHQIVEYVEALPWTEEERLIREKESLGFYLSGHPIQYYENELKQFVHGSLANIHRVARKKVIIAGLIVDIRRVNTRRGQRMAIVTLEDRTGRLDVTVFSELYQECRELWVKDTLVVIKGELKSDDFTGGYRVIAEVGRTIHQVREKLAKRLLIRVDDKEIHEQFVEQLSKILKPFMGGKIPVSIQYKNSEVSAELSFGQDWQININNELLNEINRLSGKMVAEVLY